MVHPALNEVIHIFRGQTHVINPMHVITAMQSVQTNRQGLRGVTRRPIGSIETQKRLAHVGRIRGQFLEVVCRYPVRIEKRIAKRFAQLGNERGFLGRGKTAYIDLKKLRQLNEHRRRERPAVVLDQVEVTR